MLIAHQRGLVRHTLRTLIEAEDVAVVEVDDGEAALAELAFVPFDLLILELDLPEQDGVSVVLLHRLLLMHQHTRSEPPDIILTLAKEVRRNAAVIERLRSQLGTAEFIDDDPHSEVVGLVEMILRARMERQQESGKPAVA